MIGYGRIMDPNPTAAGRPLPVLPRPGDRLTHRGKPYEVVSMTSSDDDAGKRAVHVHLTLRPLTDRPDDAN
jgi:hypothetical protein